MDKPLTTSPVPVAEKAAGGLLLAMSFLLPVKFGNIDCMPESAGFFPEDWLTYIFICWSPAVFTVAAALLLAVTAVTVRLPEAKNRSFLLASAVGFGWPLISLLGWLPLKIRYPALAQTTHLAGIAAYTLAAGWLIARRPAWGRWAVAALTAGTLITGLEAMRQYFFGFAETEAFLLQQMSAGMHVNRVILAKAMDRRVYATMASANVLAGFLLIALGAVLWQLWQWGKHFEPARWSQILLTGAGGALLGATFLMTKTRGAFLAVILIGGCWVLTLPMRRFHRFCLIVLGVFVILYGAVYIQLAGRGFRSMKERADYYSTMLAMVREKPVAGSGWGGFYTAHMRHKTTNTDESPRDPHNWIASFALHCGIPAGILAAAPLVYALVLLWKRRRESALCAVVFWSAVLFLFHSLMEINLEVPANFAACFLLIFAALGDGAPDSPDAVCTPRRAVVWRLPALLLALLTAAAGLHQLRGEIAFTRFYDALHPATIEESRRRVNPDEILRLLKQAVAARPDLPFAREMGGDFCLSIHDLAAAETLYQQAHECDPQRPAIYRRFCDLARARGDLDEAERRIKQAEQLFPSNPKYKWIYWKKILRP